MKRHTSQTDVYSNTLQEEVMLQEQVMLQMQEQGVLPMQEQVADI